MGRARNEIVDTDAACKNPALISNREAQLYAMFLKKRDSMVNPPLGEFLRVRLRNHGNSCGYFAISKETYIVVNVRCPDTRQAEPICQSDLCIGHAMLPFLVST
jgi:hypothetical protein